MQENKCFRIMYNRSIGELPSERSELPNLRCFHSYKNLTRITWIVSSTFNEKCSIYQKNKLLSCKMFLIDNM